MEYRSVCVCAARACSQCESQNKKVACVQTSEFLRSEEGLRFPGQPAGLSCTKAPLSLTVKSCGHYTGAFHGRSGHPKFSLLLPRTPAALLKCDGFQSRHRTVHPWCYVSLNLRRHSTHFVLVFHRGSHAPTCFCEKWVNYSVQCSLTPPQRVRGNVYLTLSEWIISYMLNSMTKHLF